MTDGAMEQEAADDLGVGGQSEGEFGAGLKDRFLNLVLDPMDAPDRSRTASIPE
jgi:hypothetical protein